MKALSKQDNIIQNYYFGRKVTHFYKGVLLLIL